MNTPATRNGNLIIVLAALCAVASFAFWFQKDHYSGCSRVNAHADRVVVYKSEHTLVLLQKGKVLKSYRVALGRGGLGPKLRADDDRVPEGLYRIVGRNPRSAFHRALRVGYPTPEQAAQARSRGVDPGGDIMVHGIRNGLGWLGPLQSHVDWTRGCIALTDREMDEVWRAVPDGTLIEIRH